MRQLLILATVAIIAALLIVPGSTADDLEYLFYLPILFKPSPPTELYVDNTLVGALCYEIEDSGIPFNCWYYPAVYYYGTFPAGQYREVVVTGCGGVQKEYVTFQPGTWTQTPRCPDD